MVKRLPAIWETWVQSLGQEDPLEKKMATHSSTVAWKIPWTEEPGRLQSMGLQRVGHDWATSLHFHFLTVGPLSNGQEWGGGKCWEVPAIVQARDNGALNYDFSSGYRRHGQVWEIVFQELRGFTDWINRRMSRRARWWEGCGKIFKRKSMALYWPGSVLFILVDDCHPSHLPSLVLVTLGLHCRVQAFSSCGEWGLLFTAVHGLLIAVAPLAAKHRL